MAIFYGVTRKSQIFEMVADVVEAFKSPMENTRATMELLLATAAQETHTGELRDGTPYRHGTGLMQFDPVGLEDIKTRPSAQRWIKIARERFGVDFSKVEHRELETAPLTSIIAARIKYKIVPYGIPHALEDQWLYYKKWYNSSAGAATKEEFYRNRAIILKEFDAWNKG